MQVVQSVYTRVYFGTHRNIAISILSLNIERLCCYLIGMLFVIFPSQTPIYAPGKSTG